MSAINNYDLIILGNDKILVDLLPQLTWEFTRIAWVSEEFSESIPTMWNVDRYMGQGEFVSEHSISVNHQGQYTLLDGAEILIATGSHTQVPQGRTDSERVKLAEEVNTIHELQGVVAVVGLGSRGLSICDQLAAAGQVELLPIDADQNIEIQEKNWSTAAVLGNGLIGFEVNENGVMLFLEDGQIHQVDHLILCWNQIGNVEQLNLQNCGINADDHGQLWCDEALMTWTPGVFACGSVVGYHFPTADDQDHVELLIESLAAYRDQNVDIEFDLCSR